MRRTHQSVGEQAEKSRHDYRAPVLRVYGPVGVLTQGGTGTMIETQQMMNMNFEMV